MHHITFLLQYFLMQHFVCRSINIQIFCMTYMDTKGRKYRFVEEGQFCDCTSLIDAGGMP